MANNYSESSFTVPFIEANKAVVHEWLGRYVAECNRLFDSEGTSDEYYDKVAGLQINVQHDHVWFSGDGEYFNVTAAIFWVQDLLEALDCDAGVFFSWAEWCSKARVGEFAGGACVVTRKDHMIQLSTNLLHEAAKAGIEVGNA